MASPLDSIIQLPVWQRIVAWVVVSGLIGVVWYFLWFADAVQAREGAERGLAKAEADLAAMQKKLENFEEEQRKAAEMEQEIRKLMEELPTSSATVDNLMQTFQQQARMVGLNVESWTPGGEQKLDFYAKLPVDLKAVGGWHAVGEFMRRVSEFKKIVSIENLKLKVIGGTKQVADGGRPDLEISFRASTYRFLTDEERRAAASAGGKRGSRRKTEGQ